MILKKNMQINDYHTIVNFGKYRGKRLIDVPKEYFDFLERECKYGPVYEAISRINSRRNVTSLIKDMNSQEIPKLIQDTNNIVPIINRPRDICPRLYGTFVEYLVKYALGLTKFSDVKLYLSTRGLCSPPEDIKIYNIICPDRRSTYILSSYNKISKNILDICNLSFCPSLMHDNFSELQGSKLYNHIKYNLEYYDNYIYLVRKFLHPLYDEEQTRCDKISVGCIIGAIDVIYKNTIIDIKCCNLDDLDYYRKQLYTYACLYLLRYGKYIEFCKIYNFISGIIYVMDVRTLTKDKAREHILNLGCHNIYHVKLLS